MLIGNAEVWGHGLADVQISGSRIVQLAPPGSLGAPLIDARGGALLPGLHDHHIHLAALAAQAESCPCGPPDVITPQQLAERLAQHPGTGWIRGTGYHESVMGLPDAAALDRIQRDRPLRLQHRSGRMWLLNSMGLQELLAKSDLPPGLERMGGTFTGRLFDEDQWLRTALAAAPPDFAAISAQLAQFGITGITDMSPRNDPAMAAHFDAQMASGSLLQTCHLAGTLALAQASGAWHLGPAKLHLHESALPPFDQASAFIAAAHDQGRAVAIHCVSEVELVFALALLEAAGVQAGDRIEHASVAPLELVARMAGLNLFVCVQPQFVHERGDRYLIDVEPRHHGDLYRLRSLTDAGLKLSGGSDAPFVSADPWQGMAAAQSRTTREGQTIGLEEALTPEQAMALYLADPADLSRQRRIAPGEPADLVLLDRSWDAAQAMPSAADVRATLIGGHVVYNRVDQAPV